MMDFSNFLMLRDEGLLLAALVGLIAYDIFASDGARKWFRPVACVVMGVLTVSGFLFPAPTGSAFGGIYLSSQMTSVMKGILNTGTLMVFLQGGQWLRTKEMRIREGEFYTITLATLFGMYIMVSAGNFMMLYIGIETASLPMACLAAWNKYHEKSAEAGAKYILISALSSGIMMFGLSYLYGATGTMYFSDIAAQLTSNPMVLLGFAFFFAGLAFKISLVPFHLWTADVYEGAPTAVTAYLSVVSKAAACFVLMITLYHVFGNIEAIWHHFLWWISVVTIVVGNLFALRQKDIKRFFAFSSISQAGYILLGMIGGTALSMTSVVYYVLVYLFSNFAAFGVIQAVENKSGRTDIAALNGFYKSNPRLSFVMMLAVFSLAGIPFFAGFFSKYFVFASAASRGDYLLVLIALINTVISLYYYLLIIRAMFINPADEHPVGRIRTDRYIGLSLVVCTAAILLTGLLSCIYHSINNFSSGIM